MQKQILLKQVIYFSKRFGEIEFLIPMFLVSGLGFIFEQNESDVHAQLLGRETVEKTHDLQGSHHALC